MEHKKLLEQYITKLSSSKHLFWVFEECIMTNNSTYHDNTNIFLPQVIKTCSHIVFGASEFEGMDPRKAFITMLHIVLTQRHTIMLQLPKIFPNASSMDRFYDCVFRESKSWKYGAWKAFRAMFHQVILFNPIPDGRKNWAFRMGGLITPATSTTQDVA